MKIDIRETVCSMAFKPNPQNIKIVRKWKKSNKIIDP